MTVPIPDPTWIQSYRAQLIRWYRQNRRDLPWRRTQDPYAIWISEIMLQQTQVDTVIPYYLRFLEAFPTVKALAEAEESRLFKLWEGLGYYSRVRNLQKAAKLLVEQYGGQLPAEEKALLKLPGIGPYTAGAIGSIAFGLPSAAVDGNVIRVYSRLRALDLLPSTTEGMKAFRALGSLLVDPESPSDFNQGVMELGALVCTPQSPRCGQCPVSSLCEAFAGGTVSEYPRTVPKPQKRTLYWQVTLFEHQGRTLLVPREDTGLLKGFWGIPSTLVEGPPPEAPGQLGVVRHVFTHQVWEMTVQRVPVEDAAALSAQHPGSLWADAEQLEALPIPKAFRKVLRLKQKEQV